MLLLTKTYSAIFLTIVIMTLLIGCSQAPSSVDVNLMVNKAENILYSQIEDGSIGTRDVIVRLTGGMPAKQAIPLLEIALNDSEPPIVNNAINKMLEFKDPASVQPLLSVLGDKYEPEIIKILADLQTESILPNVEKGLRSLRPHERADAVLYLQKVQGEDSKNRITDFLNDDELIVRMKAKHAMARLGDESVLEDVDDLLQSGEMVKIAQALELAREFDLKEHRDLVADIAINWIGPIGDHALGVLYDWNDDKASEILIQRLNKTHASIMTLFSVLQMVDDHKDKAAIPILNEYLSSSVPSERYSAARLILSIDPENNPHVLTFLLRGMDSDVPGIREQVAITLAKLPGIDEVKKILERKGLKDESLKVVEMSILALGKVGDRTSIDYLAPFLDSDNNVIKVTAAAAVINIADRFGSGKRTDTE